MLTSLAECYTERFYQTIWIKLCSWLARIWSRVILLSKITVQGNLKIFSVLAIAPAISLQVVNCLNMYLFTVNKGKSIFPNLVSLLR